MKIKYLLCVLVLLCVTGCSSDSKSSPESLEYEEDIRNEGRTEVIMSIRDGARSDYTYYVDAEQLEDIIRNCYGDDGVDMILFHPDVEMYSAEDIVGNAIENAGLE